MEAAPCPQSPQLPHSPPLGPEVLCVFHPGWDGGNWGTGSCFQAGGRKDPATAAFQQEQESLPPPSPPVPRIPTPSLCHSLAGFICSSDGAQRCLQRQRMLLGECWGCQSVGWGLGQGWLSPLPAPSLSCCFWPPKVVCGEILVANDTWYLFQGPELSRGAPTVAGNKGGGVGGGQDWSEDWRGTLKEGGGGLRLGQMPI